MTIAKTLTKPEGMDPWVRALPKPDVINFIPRIWTVKVRTAPN